MLLGMNSLVATDLVLCSHVLAIINVDLQDDHVAHGLGNLLEVGGNHLAWSTPAKKNFVKSINVTEVTHYH